MICVSLAHMNHDEIRSVLAKTELVELRLETLDLDDAQLKEILRKHKGILATCRPGTMSEEERIRKLLLAADHGARYVDIEVDASHEFTTQVVSNANVGGCDSIISYHNFDFTPSKEELEDIIQECFSRGAEVAKIACMVNETWDAARLLSLYEMNRRLIVIGMGEKGLVTRIAAPLLGAEFTFASLEEGKETAPGQIALHRMKKIYKELGL